ncbi:flavin monoamine oxidase family protein [Nocardia sp. CA-107356]|uniref:flavin monoamine oxidase family protein n=1 Tax=Nocardia sp. CA-107356 TaxID=3239972 RepID=UPI003D8E0F6A
MNTDFDAIVIGAGFAGATAARDLAQDGYHVLVLEARDRLGGRVFHGTFADTGLAVDFGGTWVSPTLNHFVNREIERYGVGYDQSPPTQTYGSLFGGHRFETPVPIHPEELQSFERTALHVLTAGSRFDPTLPIETQAYRDLDIPWSDFLAQADPQPATRDLFDAWVLIEGGFPTSEISALAGIWSIVQYGNSLVNSALAAEKKIGGGPLALLEPMVGHTGIEVRLATPVVRVKQEAAVVTVTTADNQSITARGVVVAVPVNCWDDIEFAPALNEDKRRGCALRPGSTGVKAFALVENAPPNFSGMSAGPIYRVSTEAEYEGASLVAFFSRSDLLDVNDRNAVQRALEVMMPGCKVIKCEGHDWTTDPYSDGSYATLPVGIVQHLAGMRAPERRLAFATADIARGKTFWIDGAIESGSAAAATLQRVLERSALIP